MSVTLDGKIPGGPIEDKLGQLQVQRQVGEPQQQAQVQDDRGGHRPGRSLGGGDARRARLPGRRVHVPRFAPPGPLDRRPGRHQRGEELPRRRRLHPAPVLRHGQGRRLPRPRGQRVPPRRRCRSTSSTRWSPRACRSPGSTAGCSTTARSVAPRSRGRSTPGGRPASSCCSGRTSSWPARSASVGCACSTAPSSSTWSPSTGRCAGIVVRDLITGEITSHAAHAVVLATGGYGNVFFLSTNAMNCNVTAAWRAHSKGAALRQPVLHPDPPDLHPAGRRHPVEAHPDVGVAAQRRPGVGPEEP